MNTMISPTAREVLEKARENHYVFQVVGDYGTPSSPVFKDGWWYVPEANPIISTNALQRVNLVKAITPIQGYIIAHEAPKMLCPPKEKEWEAPNPFKAKPAFAPRKVNINLDWPAVWKATKTVAKVAGTVILWTLYIMAMALQTLAQVDPKLIVVLEDGTWIEVMTWYE